jgi:hypothetical protein
MTNSLRIDRAVGSQTSWRMPLARPAALANSHHDGGRVFLIFVADPRTEGDAHPPPRQDSDLIRGRKVVLSPHTTLSNLTVGKIKIAATFNMPRRSLEVRNH